MLLKVINKKKEKIIIIEYKLIEEQTTIAQTNRSKDRFLLNEREEGSIGRDAPGQVSRLTWPRHDAGENGNLGVYNICSIDIVEDCIEYIDSLSHRRIRDEEDDENVCLCHEIDEEDDRRSHVTQIDSDIPQTYHI